MYLVAGGNGELVGALVEGHRGDGPQEVVEVDALACLHIPQPHLHMVPNNMVTASVCALAVSHKHPAAPAGHGALLSAVPADTAATSYLTLDP